MAPTLHVWRRFRSESHGGTIRNESDSYDNYDSSQDICCEKIPSIYKYSITDGIYIPFRLIISIN